MTYRIETVSARDRLKPRREPYWHRLAPGMHLGFRKMSAASEGTWQVRVLENGEKRETSLGRLEEYRPGERFERAVAAAQALLAEVRQAPSTVISAPPEMPHYTVGDACNAYVLKTMDVRGKKAADDVGARYRRWVAGDVIEQVVVAGLTRDQVRAFYLRVRSKPARANYSGGTRPRAKSTVNRDIAALRAALNYAHAEGHVGSDAAWKSPLKAIPNATQRRRLYLDKEQRRALIHAADDDIRPFLKAMATLPLRPGAMASLDVSDYDRRLHTLIISEDKGGHNRILRLPPEAGPSIADAADQKTGSDPLFSRKDGARWNKDSWKQPIKQAASRAKLPPTVTAYTIRHSVITDLVHGGLDLLTVAQISGTSVAMIEKHYGHLRSEVALTALAKLAI